MSDKCKCVEGMQFAIDLCPSDSKTFRGQWLCPVHGRISFGKDCDFAAGYRHRGEMNYLPGETQSDLHKQVVAFHKEFCPDQGLGEGPPAIPHVDVIRCRFSLITEEYFEALNSILPFSLSALPLQLHDFQHRAWADLTLARQAIDDAVKKWGGNAVDLAELADALADLDYVVEGTRIAFGIDGKPIADEVHRSNMSKVDGHRREDGKWEKPETYSKADIESELRKQGWNSGVAK